MNMNIEFEQEIYEDLRVQADREKLNVGEFLKKIANQFLYGTKPKEKTLDEQIREAFRAKNYPMRFIETNEKGELIIDKDKDPDLYDWAVNG